ncbi:MAG TPA: cobalamin-binding protein [Solirubrobacteraceae bacterium]|jgi:iron complex transport system substrate-binding protein|nr:cobalamin-binding protein [Solirubrobacteraceae bacterium]
MFVRIVSLVPHATELLFALGLGSEVVAVTHECDYPPEAQTVARVTRDVLPGGLSAAEIDAAVRERTLRGEAIYELDEQAIADLTPDLIVTQALCPVCAVSYTEVSELAERLPCRPGVVSLDPHTLGETLNDVHTLADATGRVRQATELAQNVRERIDRIERAVRGRRRPRVVALEWLDPVYIAGHWTPELIDLAGGEDLLGTPGGPSVTVTWEAVIAARPEVVVVMPCGYDAPRAHSEALSYASDLAALEAAQVVAVDASAYFSRPGPRLIDGLELLAQILHPEQISGARGASLPVALGSPDVELASTTVGIAERATPGGAR